MNNDHLLIIVTHHLILADITVLHSFLQKRSTLKKQKKRFQTISCPFVTSEKISTKIPLNSQKDGVIIIPDSRVGVKQCVASYFDGRFGQSVQLLDTRFVQRFYLSSTNPSMVSFLAWAGSCSASLNKYSEMIESISSLEKIGCAMKLYARFELLWHLHPFIGLINFFQVAGVVISRRCSGA